jgi:hypothetical protein
MSAITAALGASLFDGSSDKKRDALDALPDLAKETWKPLLDIYDRDKEIRVLT